MFHGLVRKNIDDGIYIEYYNSIPTALEAEGVRVSPANQVSIDAQQQGYDKVRYRIR
jgi:hypothetical protein